MNLIAEYQNIGCWINEAKGIVIVGAAFDDDFSWRRNGDYGRQTIAEFKADPGAAHQLCMEWLTAQYERLYNL